MAEVASRFGPLEYDESQVLRMVGGLIGMPDVSRFVLIESPEVEPFKWMVSVDGNETSLLVIDPRLLDSEFKVSLQDEDRRRLEIDSNDEAILPLAVAVLDETPAKSTANLRAPILINATKMVALQVAPTESPYSVCHPLSPERAG